jgi:hypothetical protein
VSADENKLVVNVYVLIKLNQTTSQRTAQAQSESMPETVTKQITALGTEIVLQSSVDSLEVTAVRFNRGNCPQPFFVGGQLSSKMIGGLKINCPITLKFGDLLVFDLRRRIRL